ncbi:MAG: hypothetical protein MZV64_28390 [Ignavibacteriales bacterium]|nr:hypothetical protein [Ignavibacteriales bacterium]
MGGLCLGSLGYSRVASASRHPLRMLRAARGGHRRHRPAGARRDAGRRQRLLELGRAGHARRRAARAGGAASACSRRRC